MAWDSGAVVVSGGRWPSLKAAAGGQRRGARGKGEMKLGFPLPVTVRPFCSREERGGPSDANGRPRWKP